MKSKWDSCPICGSIKMKRVKKTLTFNTKKRKVKVPNLEFDACDSCKEQFFDEEANKIIDTYVSRTSKKQTVHSK